MHAAGNPRRLQGRGTYAKKNTIFYGDRDEGERSQFLTELEAIPDGADIFYEDESGFDEDYRRDRGRAPRGKRVFGKAQGAPHARTSAVAARKPGPGQKLVAAFAYKGSMDADLFCGWVSQVFAPTLADPANTWLILDNARFHRREDLEELAEEFGFHVLFLPRRSPDLNPIEHSWANIKAKLKLYAQGYANFWEAFTDVFQSA